MNEKPDIRKVRRVVAGLGEDGRSTVVSDGPSPFVKEVFGYIDFAELWVTPSPPPAPGEPFEDAAATAPEGLEPDDPHGALLRVSVYQPHSESFDQFDLDEAMHATRTVDFAFILHGEMVCVFEDGEVTLRAGDVVVQRGTQHAWVNRSDEPAQIGFVMMGALDHNS